MKKKIFLGIFIVLLIVVGVQFFSFESDRDKLRGYLGVVVVDIPEKQFDCKILEGSGPLKDTAVILIHGHGNSLEDVKKLAFEIVATGRTAVVCRNFGFEESERQEWKWVTYLMLWNGASYQGLMVNTYGGVIANLKESGYDEIILVGFSMGSHIAMYTGALNSDVDYTIGISGLAPYTTLYTDAPTSMVPKIHNEFTMGDISCMNKKMTWLQGIRDTVYPLVDAKKVPINCDTVELRSFESVDETGGVHEIPTNLVIDLLENYEENK